MMIRKKFSHCLTLAPLFCLPLRHVVLLGPRLYIKGAAVQCPIGLKAVFDCFCRRSYERALSRLPVCVVGSKMPTAARQEQSIDNIPALDRELAGK